MAIARAVRHGQDMTDTEATQLVEPTVFDGVLLTAAEHRRFAAELTELQRIRDRDLPDLLRNARTFVAEDALEEIAQIREDDAFVRARIAHLEDLLADAAVAAGSEAAHIATLGRTVDVQYLRTGRVRRFRLAGSVASAADGAVSARSPVGRALMGRAEGDVVSVELPNGRAEELRLLAVSADRPALTPPSAQQP